MLDDRFTDTEVHLLERAVRMAIREKFPDAMAQHVRYVAGKASDLIRKNMHHLGYRAIIKSGARNTRDNETTKPAA